VIVVDANVAIKWVIEQPHFERARRLVEQGDDLLVPGMFVAEITTTIWKYVRSKQINEEQAQSGVTSILSLISYVERDAHLAEDALRMGLDLNYAPYDCFYLVLAMRRSAPFVTADKRLINRLTSTRYKAHVVHLADWT
jgi:predicted nucleic acid-binding protein